MNDRRPDILKKLCPAAPLLAAVYKTGSFSTAAAELWLTQSNISNRVRALEDALGYGLFSRTTRHVEPTRRGHLICAAAQTSVDALGDAFHQSAKLESSRDTLLSVSSSIAMKWLVPAMARAKDRGLRLSLRIDVTLAEIGAKVSRKWKSASEPGPIRGCTHNCLRNATRLPSCGKAREASA